MATFNGLQAPDNIAVGLNIAYTVPVGKVARVTCTLSVTASAYFSSLGLGTAAELSEKTTGMASSNSAEKVCILPEGTIISGTGVTGAGTTTIVASTFNSRVGTCSMTMVVNGSNSGSISTQASVSAVNNDSSNNATLTTTGVASFGFIAEEYYG